MAEKVEQDIHSGTNGADDDSVLDRGINKDDEHESGEIVDETVTRSKGKTKTINTSDAAIPSEDETSPSKFRISCIKASSKYPHSFQQFSPSPSVRVKLRELRPWGVKT